MKNLIYLAAILVFVSILGCEKTWEDEKIEPVQEETTSTFKQAGPVDPIGTSVQLKMYFQSENVINNSDYAGIQLSLKQKLPKEVKIVVQYWSGNYSIVFVPQEFVIPAYSYHSNKLYNVSVYDAGMCGAKTIKMSIVRVYYGGVLTQQYSVVPSSGSISCSLYGSCDNPAGPVIDTDHDSFLNWLDNCPTVYGKSQGNNGGNGCPD